MKQVNFRWANYILALGLMLLFTLKLFAQDKLDVDVNIGKEAAWYTQPWVWIVGGAVFILLLVALLRKQD
jgi:hypothetical protein